MPGRDGEEEGGGGAVFSSMRWSCLLQLVECAGIYADVFPIHPGRARGLVARHFSFPTHTQMS